MIDQSPLQATRQGAPDDPRRKPVSLKLRDYQRGANDAINTALFTDGAQRIAVVLPTGAGKTVCFADLSKGYVSKTPGKRVLILAHTDELIRQAAKKVKDAAPDLKVGIVKGPIRQTKADVIVASVQSLRDPKKRYQIQDVGLVIVDECHHATAKTYVDILRHYGCLPVCPACYPLSVPEEGCEDCAAMPASGKAAGFTATLMRSDKTSLAKIWQGVAYKKDISFMIRAGYLVPPRGKHIVVDDLDLAKVKKKGGDYADGDLGRALEASLAPETVAKAYVEHAKDRAGVLFAPTVASAYVFAEELDAAGIRTEVIHGALDPKERRAILARLESGETQVIANCMVLTEGFDCPRVSCVVVARPTKSSPLYQQMVGRGLRPDLTIAREGQDCLILDVVGISGRHTLASLIDLSDEEEWQKILCEQDEDCEEEEEGMEETGEGEAPGPDYVLDGPIRAVDFDPLAAANASSRVWLKTAGGTWFLSAGTDAQAVYVFVIPATKMKCECRGGECVEGEGHFWCKDGTHENVHPDSPGFVCMECDGYGNTDPDPGTYDVVWCTKDSYARREGRGGDITNHRGLSLEMAFAWGEDVAVEMAGGIASGSMTLNKSASWRKTKPSDKQLALCKSRGIQVPEGASKGDVSALIDGQFASRRIDPIAEFFARQ